MEGLEIKKCVVITGSIGCGKSSVCDIIRQRGYEVIDADKISKNITSVALPKIVEEFGEEYLLDGALNSKKMGALIFSDSIAKKKLESILHPLIRGEIYKKAKELEMTQELYFADIPLYFEGDGYKDIPLSAVVYTAKESQLERVIARDNISKDEAIKRINSQMDIETKAKMANFVIDNTGEMDKLSGNVDKFLEEVKLWFYKNTAQAETTFCCSTHLQKPTGRILQNKFAIDTTDSVQTD